MSTRRSVLKQSLKAATALAVAPDLPFWAIAFQKQQSVPTSRVGRFATAGKARRLSRADRFGILPATAFFLRYAWNIELTNVEVATAQADARPAIWADHVDGLDVFRSAFPEAARLHAA